MLLDHYVPLLTPVRLREIREKDIVAIQLTKWNVLEFLNFCNENEIDIRGIAENKLSFKVRSIHDTDYVNEDGFKLLRENWILVYDPEADLDRCIRTFSDVSVLGLFYEAIQD